MALEAGPVAVYNAELLRPNAAYIRVSKEYTPRVVLTYDTAVMEAIQALRSEIAELKQQVLAFMAGPSGSSAQLAHAAAADDRSDDQLLIDVKAFFEDAGDDVVYPSDVAESLSISYDKAVMLIEGLEQNGQITKA